MQVWADRAEKDIPQSQFHLRDFIHQKPGKILIRGQVNQKLVNRPQVVASLKNAAAREHRLPDHGIIGLLMEESGSLGQVTYVPVSVDDRELPILQVAERGVFQGESHGVRTLAAPGDPPLIGDGAVRMALGLGSVR